MSAQQTGVYALAKLSIFSAYAFNAGGSAAPNMIIAVANTFQQAFQCLNDGGPLNWTVVNSVQHQTTDLYH